MSGNGWVGVDLDGTLAEYDTWKGPDHIGAPIMPMVERVKNWIAQGLEVKIFTARVCGLWLEPDSEGYISSAASHIAIGKWLAGVGLPDLDVTCIKDYRMDELYDDRCVTVEKNTGRLLAPSPRGLATP